jgi:mannose-1-phosphate guanylyltransferase
VTLGIQPSRPDTGYGYINFKSEHQDGVHPVVKFTEKPDLETARKFVAGGDYLWNAGIFIWRAKVVLEAFQQHATQIHEILSKGNEVYNSDGEQAFIDENYPKTPSISVDYAIMEKAENVYTIPSSFGWSDLGTWASLHAESEKDEQGNVVQGEKVILKDAQNSLIRVPEDKVVVIKGLDDFIVVDEGDVLLIYPKSDEQEVKQITKEIQEKGW